MSLLFMIVENVTHDATNLFVAAIHGVWRWWLLVLLVTSAFYAPSFLDFLQLRFGLMDRGGEIGPYLGGAARCHVILNGDSPTPTRVVDGVLQPVAPTTAEQRLARKNKLKARGTLLMALPYKHQLKFNSHKDAKTLMEAIEKRFGGNIETKKRTHTLIWRNKTDLEEQSLDDLFNGLKIYEAEVKSSSSASTSTQNIAFVSSSNIDSTNEPVSAAASVSAVSTKIHVSPLPNVDSLMRARRFLQRTGRNLEVNRPTSIGFDMSKVECYNCHRKGHFARECRFPKDTKRNDVAEPQRRNVPVKTSTSNALVSQCDGSDESLPPSPIYDRYQSGNGYHVVPPPFTRTSMPTKPDLVFNNAPNVVETDHPAFTDEYETKTPQHVPSFVQPTEQVKSSRHYVQHDETSIPLKTAIPKPTSNGKRRNRKACFVCKSLDHLIKDYDYHEKKMAQPTTRNHAHRGNHKHYAQMTLQTPQRHVIPAAVVTQSKQFPLVLLDQLVLMCLKSSPSPKASNSPPIVTTVKAAMVNAAQGVIDSGCSRHMTGNMSYLSDFEELNGGYVAFGGNPKGGKISRKSVLQMCDKKNSVLFIDTKCLVLSPDFKLPDESQVLLRVPKENNMYNVNLKNIVPSGDLTCLFAKAPIDESNLWDRRVLVTKPHNKTPYELLHGRTPSIGFIRPFGCLVTIFNTLDSLGKFDGNVDERFLVEYYVSSKSFRVFNNRTRIVQETLHVNFLENKPNVAGSGPTWLFDIDTLTKTVNYQPVTAGNQSNLSAGFQDKFDAEKAGEESDQQYVLFPVWSSGSTNPQNTNGDDAFDKKEHEFDVKKPESELNVSPSSSAQSKKHDNKTKREAIGKSHVEIKDITYSDDEDDVSAEADFNNLKTSITMFNDDFHTCMFACFLSQEEPKRVHQALKDPSWIEAMQEELLQFKMQKNKKEERGIVVRNKARLVTQRHTQNEGIDYEEVFAPVARIKAIRLFLAYVSFIGFMVYQMDVKSVFLYGTIEEEDYICQPPGFEDPDHPDKVYKVVKALYGLRQALRA
nr:putative ribonuclease H-like domain-containing protein [Tanacetum cinerariifolium]